MSRRQDTCFELVSIVELEGPEYKLVGNVALINNLGDAGGSGRIGRLVVPSIGGMSELEPRSCLSLSARGSG